jgi:hypothetical protein
MVQLPAALRKLYRIATRNEVRSWSFGALKTVRVQAAASWSETRGSLNDQAIFGAVDKLACACGKFQGARYERMICDRCGVKLTSADGRRSRFAHVDLATSIHHPLGLSGETIEAYPIVPAAYFESTSGQGLANLYDKLIISNATKNNDEVATVVDQIVDLLVPTWIESFNWNLAEADLFARGIGMMADSYL